MSSLTDEATAAVSLPDSEQHILLPMDGVKLSPLDAGVAGGDDDDDAPLMLQTSPRSTSQPAPIRTAAGPGIFRKASGLHTPPLVRPPPVGGSTNQTRSQYSDHYPDSSASSTSVPTTRIQPTNIFNPHQPHRSRSSSNVAINIRSTVQPQSPPDLGISPGHPQHAEPLNSFVLNEVNRNGISAGRLQQLEPDSTLDSLKPISVRKGSLVPKGEIVGVGSSATRKAPRSILSRIMIPSIKTQLVFRRKLSIAIWILTILFFLTPAIGILYIHFGTSESVPPSTDHHKDVDGPFYSTYLRWLIGSYGVVYFIYFIIISVWSVRRAGFFPFKIRPLFLVYASNFWGLLILMWIWSRYVLSDVASFDTSDGLFPPCLFTQFILGLSQVALILPYILRAWQLARIFNAEFGTSSSSSSNNGKLRDRHDPARSSASSSYVPPSPSIQSSAYLDDAHHLTQSVESTPHFAPQASPSPSRAFLTHSLTARNGHLPTTDVNRTPTRGHKRDASTASSQYTPHRRAPTTVAYSHTISTGQFMLPSNQPQHSPSRSRDLGATSPAESPLLHGVSASPALTSDGRSTMPNFLSLADSAGGNGPATTNTVLVPVAATDPVDDKESSSRLTGCLDNLNDHKLNWIYFLLLLPFVSLSILSHFIPNLQFMTNYECTDHGPQSVLSRIIWSCFGLLEVVGFSAGLYTTRRVWDGFEIRRELLLGFCMQSSLIFVTLISIFTHEYAKSQQTTTNGQLTSTSSTADEFDRFFTIFHELLLIIRSILLFHVSMALPLVESYDLNALPVTKARMRLDESSSGGHRRIDSLELRDRTPSVSLHLGTPARRDGRTDSRASDFNASQTSSATTSKRGSKINTNAAGGPSSTRSSFSHANGPNGNLTTALLSDPSMSNIFPLSPSNLEQIAYGMSHHQSMPSQQERSSSIPLTLTYIISHPDYFQFFVDYLSRDAQMELLWNFYISIVLYQDLDADDFERKEMAQKIYQKFFDEETLKGNTAFSQWILTMANVLQQEYCVAHGTAVSVMNASKSLFLLGEREQVQALDRVDDEIQRIAQCVFSEEDDSGKDLSRDLFDQFQHASLEIMEVIFFPKFLRSRYYKRLLREIQKSSVIQARIEQAHFL